MEGGGLPEEDEEAVLEEVRPQKKMHKDKTFFKEALSLSLSLSQNSYT